MSQDSLKFVEAQKDHWCTLCGHKIPKGHKYWRHYDEFHDTKEHSNCLEYRKEQLMEGFKDE